METGWIFFRGLDGNWDLDWRHFGRGALVWADCGVRFMTNDASLMGWTRPEGMIASNRAYLNEVQDCNNFIKN